MLIKFSAENYRSIQEKQTLSLEQDKSISDGNDPIIYNEDGLPNLLRTLAIYGANGSGKSSLLRAAQEMRAFILASAKSLSEGDRIKVSPFLLDRDSKDKPSRFEIEFIYNGTRYHYKYAATDKKIVEEVLDAYPNRAKQTWFSRTLTDPIGELYNWSFSTHFKGERETIKNSTRSNALFFSTAVLLNNEMLKPLQEFFADKFFVEPNSKITSKHTESYMRTHPHGRENVVRFLKNADIDIDDFVLKSEHLKEEQVGVLLEQLPKNIPEEEKTRIRQQMLKEEVLEIKSVHLNPETNKKVEFPLSYESVGTLKLLAMAGLWLHSLETGRALLIDEIETSLHCRLVGYLIKMFNNPKTNPKNAQLVFTTHSSVALDSNELRRDQVWFTKKKSSHTILYPLLKARIDGRLVRKDEKRIKAYLEGEYSAVPEMDAQYRLF